MAGTVSPNQSNNNILYDNCIPEWQLVLNSSREEQRFERGERVFVEGETVTKVFFVVHGKIKIHQTWNAQKELIIRFAGNGEMLGHRGLGKEKKYPVTATTLEDSIVFSISVGVFEASLRANPGLTYALMDFYASELEYTEKRVRNTAHMEVKSRIIEALLLLKSKFGSTAHGFIDVKLTKQDIASYVGTTYETTSRVISELESEKLLKTSGKHIGLLKEAQLYHMIKP